MTSSHYRLITRWTLDGTADEVAAIFSDTESLVRWYPATYLDATVLRHGVPGGDTGKIAQVRVKGWMPHTLRFTFCVSYSAPPLEFTLDTWGDFEGQLVCTSEPVGDKLALYYDWRIRVAKPFVRHFSWLLRPMFVSNHLWVVARGEESLNLELRRRRAAAQGVELAEQPPGPTFPHGPLRAYLRSPIWSLAPLVDSRTFDARPAITG